MERPCVIGVKHAFCTLQSEVDRAPGDFLQSTWLGRQTYETANNVDETVSG